jgi:ABC-type transport system, involved in lipoprotein release, permease component
MIGRRIVWKMALANAKLSWKQTVLTIIAGAIGTMLIVMAYVQYTSVGRSADDWINRHYGAVSWELIPKDNALDRLFSNKEVEQITDGYARVGDSMKLLPVVSTDVYMVKLQADGQAAGALPGVHVMGFSSSAAASYDTGASGLWTAGMADDSAIIDEQTASLSGLNVDDAIRLEAVNGNSLLVQVKRIVPTEGLPGYRGHNASSLGTVIVAEAAARQLTGMKEGYDRLLARNAAGYSALSGFALPEGSEQLFQPQFVKWDAMNQADQMRKQYIMVFLISSVAIASCLLLLRQILAMIADARRELFGVLRALGLSRGHIRSMFVAEAMVLSIVCVVLGTALGIGSGVLLVKLFYGTYAEELARSSGMNIPVVPYLSIGSLLIVMAVIVLFMMIVALLVARKAGKVRIIDALRGGYDTISHSRSFKKRHMKTTLMFMLAGGAILWHSSQLVGEPLEPTGESFVWMLLAWLSACLGTLYIILRVAGHASGPIDWIARTLRFPQVSILLAGRFSRQHPARTYSIALLFALMMMMLTMTASLYLTMLDNQNVEKTNQTVLGYNGYVGYDTQEQKQRILDVVANNEEVQSVVKRSTALEPYMLTTTLSGTGMAFVPVTEELLAGGGLQLRQRAAQFATDEEVWLTVKNDPRYIVLPMWYLYPYPDQSEFDTQTLVNAGDTIEMPIYEEKGFYSFDEKRIPVETRTFIVAGFAENNSESRMQTYLYRTTYVNPALHEELRKYGYKWPDHFKEGLVLLQYNDRDMKLTQRLEETMLMNGITTFESPYANNRAEQLINKQLVRGFIGFTMVAALIGLFGLVIVQLRAVQERARSIAMLRCVGLSRSQISRMFMLEGSLISIAGLAVGWLIGSTGAQVFINTLKQDTRPGDQPVLYQYPFDTIIPLLLTLLAAALVMNMAPARGALKLAPAEALREAQQ